MPRRRDDDDYDDDYDDLPRRRRRSESGIEGVIPFRNGMALGAYYCGVFGLISCFLGLGIFGVVPIILGVLALVKANKEPRVGGQAHAWVGIVLGVIEMLSSCAIVGFFIMAAMQNPR